MQSNESKSAIDQLNSQVEDADDKLDESDLPAVSADIYERRRKMWTKFDQGDWWIAVGLYAVLASVAFVVL